MSQPFIGSIRMFGGNFAPRADYFAFHAHDRRVTFLSIGCCIYLLSSSSGARCTMGPGHKAQDDSCGCGEGRN